MKTPRHLASSLALAGAFACTLAVPTASPARTVYDAGKAFNEAGANVNSFGPWSLWHASSATLASTAAFGTYSANSGVYKGITRNSPVSAPWIRVNTSASAQNAVSGEVILPNEFYLHPGNPSQANPCDVVRFTVPEAGWYSALVFAHDVNYGSGTDGVVVTIRAGGNALAQQNVSLESVAWSTRRFDFQMPVRWMSAGETIEVVIGPNDAHSNDATGLRFQVTKEDEGAFYDSGIAMTNNLATRYENPYGSIEHGTWYALSGTVTDQLSALTNVSSMASSRIQTRATSSTYLKGFANAANGQSPCVLVNTRATSAGNAAPNELYVHPTGSNLKNPVFIRFRPPMSGFYTGSVVARDLNKSASTDPKVDGVDVFLYASDALVTNTYIYVSNFTATAHFTLDTRFMAAGEPIDIVVAGHNNASSDGTGISAIFRREGDPLCDAGISYYREHESRNCSNYFSDQSDNAAKWLLAMKSDPWLEAHSPLGTYLTPSGTSLDWWTHATGTSNNGTTPRFAMATNGIASIDSLYLTSSPLLSTTPYELVVQPSATASPSLRAEVPSNGVYRARSYARDLNNNTSANGVRVLLSAGGYGPDSAIVSRDNGAAYPYEAAVAADCLWMKSGEALYFTVDSRADSASDATALSACYVKTGDAPTARVVNIDIGGAGDGRLSSFAGRGREGWSDWTAWNALRTGTAASATVENCREADGTTPRNVTVTLSGAVAAASGSTGCAMLDTGTADSCTFTVAKLTQNAAYTLYLYGTGDAAFTVGGETKFLDGLWFRSDYEPCFARFETTADANGEITGSFAASATGDAFSGLSIVGEFPEFVPSAFVMVLR